MERGKQWTRRGFLAGMGGAAVGAAVAAGRFGESAPSDNPELPAAAPPVPEPAVEESLAGPETTEAVEYDKSNSTYFNAERDAFADQYAAELVTIDDTDTIIQLLTEHFDVSAIDNYALRTTITNLIPGLAFVESRFTSDRTSSAGAFGLMQLMPATWDELALPTEQPDDVVAQIKVAGRLFVQAYQHITTTCRAELALIRENHFAGNEEAFAVCFLAPVLIGSYNAGMGNLEQIIKQFAATFPSPADTVALFDEAYILTGYDVYAGMATTAMLEEWRSRYKEHAREYTAKVYGAHEALRRRPA